ncbi:MAG: MBL fold metallo-hydrolase [Nitrospiraceae bacterium]|nr:MAG: MBL fold metallo-hydrolase [Nitrospiraceae bacterium]
MKLVILGSGTAVPSLKRSAPAYYLEGEGREILMDCGSGTVLQLERIGRSYKSIDAVFITHTHPDHVAGLLPLIHGLIATPLFKMEKDLLLVGPEGFTKYYRKHIESVFGKVKTSFIRVVEIEDKLDFPPFHIFSTQTVHVKNSIAFRFESGIKSVVFTGDADFDQGIISLSRGVDILIADCAFPESMKKQGHMTPRECGIVAKKSGVKKLILSHLHPLPVHDIDKLKECREVFQGDVQLAEDLMEFNL